MWASERTFCWIVVGTITLVSSFCCLRNFFLKRLFRRCLAFLCTGCSMYATEAACVLIDEGWLDLAKACTHDGGQRDQWHWSSQTPQSSTVTGQTRAWQLSTSLQWGQWTLSLALTGQQLGSLASVREIKSLRRPWDDNLNKQAISSLEQRWHWDGKVDAYTHFRWLRVQWTQFCWNKDTLVIFEDACRVVTVGGNRHCRPLTLQL